MFFALDEKSSPSERSWWPTITKFEDSGLNLGVWTPNCEYWFRHRQQCILGGTHGAYSAAEWRTYLRFEMETKRILKGAREIATRYLQDHSQHTNTE